MSASSYVEKLIFREGSSDVLFSNNTASITREEAVSVINKLASLVHYTSSLSGARVGLVGLHRYETMLALLGLALGGAEVFLVDHSDFKSKSRQIAEDWNLDQYFLPTEISRLDDSWSQVGSDSVIDFQISTDADFFTVLSSGTTGTPKAITHSFLSSFGSALDFSYSLKAEPRDCFLHNWPMHYMAGIFNLFLCPLVAGASIHVAEPFSTHVARSQLSDMARLNVNRVLVSPTMVNILTRIGSSMPPNLSSLDIVCTSSILYPSVAVKFSELFQKNLRTCYGITEYGGSFTLGEVGPEDYSVGFPTRSVEIAVENQEILVKTPHVAKKVRYLDGGEKTFDPKVFHSTSDLGRMSQSGEVVLLGRTGDTIKKGGEFLSLVAVENCALTVTGISDVMAIPSSSDFWGQDFRLKIVIDPLLSLDADDVVSRVSKHLASAMSARAIPVSIEIEDSIVRTSSGKPLRRFYLEN